MAKIGRWKRDAPFCVSDPTSIIFFSYCSELEEMVDGTVAWAIHCSSVSSGFIFSLVCRGRHRTGRLRL